MSSKLYILGCVRCGEFTKGIMNDSIEQFEMHMCREKDLDKKKQKLLKLREAVDVEIAKTNEMVSTKAAAPPPPPPPPPALPAPLAPKMPSLLVSSSSAMQKCKYSFEKIEKKY